MTIWFFIDRILVFCIATAQFLYSGYLLLFFLMGYAGAAGPVPGQYLFVVGYMLAGVISAAFLFTGRLSARAIAIVWQGMLVAGTWSKFDDPHDAFVWVALATVYLGVTAVLQFRKKQGSRPSLRL
jgi:hypothetical protein